MLAHASESKMATCTGSQVTAAVAYSILACVGTRNLRRRAAVCVVGVWVCISRKRSATLSGCHACQPSSSQAFWMTLSAFLASSGLHVLIFFFSRILGFWSSVVVVMTQQWSAGAMCQSPTTLSITDSSAAE